MSILRLIQNCRTRVRNNMIRDCNPGFVHGNNWRVCAITDDGPEELYEGYGRIPAQTLRALVQEYRTDDNEIYIEGRYDWSPSLYEWTRNGEYEIGEYWTTNLSKGLYLDWTK